MVGNVLLFFDYFLQRPLSLLFYHSNFCIIDAPTGDALSIIYTLRFPIKIVIGINDFDRALSLINELELTLSINFVSFVFVIKVFQVRSAGIGRGVEKKSCRARAPVCSLAPSRIETDAERCWRDLVLRPAC